jgi:hypothetical protein
MFVLVSFSLLVSRKKQEPAKLVLSPDMVINEVAKRNAALLVDEQGAGNELPAEPPSTAWTVLVSEGELSWYLSANAVQTIFFPGYRFVSVSFSATRTFESASGL